MKAPAFVSCGVAGLALAQAVVAGPGLTGRVIERVGCQVDPAQTCALYVPSHYTPEKKWPVIYCFDPGARGWVPVGRLQAAAEKFGYIVAGSNNSRNGPWAPNAVAIDAMMNDVRMHLAVDSDRVYAAGLSGGARVATQVAMVRFARGVIACSAGFPVPEDVPRKVPFVFFGTAGTEDFNYPELRELDGQLDDRHAVHRVVFFEGGHEWASAALLTEAVEWLELQALRAGARPKDEALVQRSLRARVAALGSLAPGPAWREIKSLVADFKGLADTAELEQRAKVWDGSREVKAWRKAERELANREDKLTARLNRLSTDGSEGGIRDLSAELRRKAEAPEDSDERRMVRRAIGGVSIASRERVRALLAEKEYGSAVALLELAVALRPGQSRPCYDLARACAFAGRRARALEALRQAATAGFSDAARAEAEPAFAKLKGEPAFRKVLEQMRANPPEAERGEGERRGR